MNGVLARAFPIDSSNRYGRSDRSAVGRWFWEIDRVLLVLVAVLIAIGLVAVAAASPAAGQRYSGGTVTFAPLYYFYRQLMWLAVSLPVMIFISMLPREQLKRLCLIGTAACIVAMILVPIIGPEKNGARRWISFGFAQFQPSEFLKPLYIVAVAWLLSLKEKDRGLPVMILSGALTAVIAALLMIQPDFGSTIIFATVWVVMIALAGANVRMLGAMAVSGVIGIILAYFFYDVAQVRIDGFLFGEGDNFQVENALRTLTAGGLLGMGPGGGTRKFHLPEPHTDYIFSVIGEEFGLIACMAIAVIYCAIVVRVLVKLLDEDEPFAILAAAGLACQFGLQALINMSTLR